MRKNSNCLVFRPRRNCGGGGIEKRHSANIQVFIQTPDCYPEIWKASRSLVASTPHPTPPSPSQDPRRPKVSCKSRLHLGLKHRAPRLPSVSPQRQKLQTRCIIFGRSLSAFLSLTYIYIYTYMYMCVCVYICVCVCVYTWRQAWGCSGVDGVQGGIATLLYVFFLLALLTLSYILRTRVVGRRLQKKLLKKKHWSTNRQKKTKKKDYARC